MKLKNKQTGKIGEAGYLATSDGKIIVSSINNRDELYEYNSLAELNEEWEDYEEPKEYWYIDWAYLGINDAKYSNDDVDKFNISIGNYFSSKEEAELAVRKLKAWKRLKDKGFRFSKWFTRVEGGIQINMEYIKYDGIDSECRNDLDILFGGEE